ncbi:MAG: hypothetical protein OXG15_08805 [Gammaproteobacteria bacterium]|nr:hypothetical protein [Gammaproteobacteria bacterium]
MWRHRTAKLASRSYELSVDGHSQPSDDAHGCELVDGGDLERLAVGQHDG